MDHEHAPECMTCPLKGTAADRVPDTIERRAFVRSSIAGSLMGLGLRASIAVAVAADAVAALPIGATTGRGTRTDKAYPIPATDGMTIDKDESVIIARAQGRVYALSLACPHQNTAVAWDAPNDRFECPKHKSRFHLDGTFIEGRAKRGLDRFAVTSGDNPSQLLVNLDAVYREDQNAAEWGTAYVTLA